MAEAISQGRLPTTPTFYARKNVLDNEEYTRAPKKRRCCRRMTDNSPSTESEISLESLDGYVSIL